MKRLLAAMILALLLSTAANVYFGVQLWRLRTKAQELVERHERFVAQVEAYMRLRGLLLGNGK